jgi:hypothetical protein
MPFISGAAAVLALQLGMPAVQNEMPEVVQVGGYCGHGYDIDIHGRCYPNGVIPPQYQAKATPTISRVDTTGKHTGHVGDTTTIAIEFKQYT